MFAPDHQRVADKLLRVCRPGGVIGMANWTPEGSIGEFLRLFGPYLPPPPGGIPPVAWGTEEHVATLFGDRVESLWTGRRSPGPGEPARYEYEYLLVVAHKK
jgi:2-polyprenyl-6-hydroxyphenyl methylase/3-demethylubiquinone-9 3-methyltransferase